MLIETVCPNCGTVHDFPEDQLGERVRCLKCDESFVISRSRERRRPRSAAAEREDDYEDRRDVPDLRRRQRSSSGAWPAVMVIGIVAIVVFTPIAICGGVIYLIYRQVQAVAEKVAPPPPADGAQAAAYLRSGDPFKRNKALEWLGQSPAEQEHQQEVSVALDPVLSDNLYQTRNSAVWALKNWATRENVRSLISVLGRIHDNDAPQGPHNSGDTRRLVIDILARLKDERAIAPIAGYLVSPADRQTAARALEEFGPAAIPEVKKYLDNADPLVRDEARKVLQKLAPNQKWDEKPGP